MLWLDFWDLYGMCNAFYCFIKCWHVNHWFSSNAYGCSFSSFFLAETNVDPSFSFGCASDVVQLQMYTHFEQSSLLLPRDKELQRTDICLPELHPHRNKSFYMIVPWWSRNLGENLIMFSVPRGYCCLKSYGWALVSNRIIIMTVC
jgi:hypothetical protein